MLLSLQFTATKISKISEKTSPQGLSVVKASVLLHFAIYFLKFSHGRKHYPKGEKMVKKVLIAIFATLIVGAAGVSAYNTATAPTPVSAQDEEEVASLTTQQNNAALSQSEVSSSSENAERSPLTDDSSSATPMVAAPQIANTDGEERHGGQGGAESEHGNNANRGGGSGEFTTLHGVVTASDASFVSVVTDEGGALTFPLDSASVGISLQPGDGVLLTGMWRGEGFFKAKQLTLDSTGATYFLRGNGGGGGGKGGGGGHN
jgi:hypothetical protein